MFDNFLICNLSQCHFLEIVLTIHLFSIVFVPIDLMSFHAVAGDKIFIFQCVSVIVSFVVWLCCWRCYRGQHHGNYTSRLGANHSSSANCKNTTNAFRIHCFVHCFFLFELNGVYFFYLFHLYCHLICVSKLDLALDVPVN